MDTVIIRKSNANDMKYVMNLIKELAEFENMLDRVKINASVLEKDGFESPIPFFMCYVAETEDLHIIGYALFYNTYSTWLGKSIFLEDLYVQPMYRHKGIGKQLFLAVAKEAYHCKTRLDFQVLAWNPALKFYEKLGAENLTKTEQWNSVRLNFDALNKLFNEETHSIQLLNLK